MLNGVSRIVQPRSLSVDVSVESTKTVRRVTEGDDLVLKRDPVDLCIVDERWESIGVEGLEVTAVAEDEVDVLLGVCDGRH